MTIKIKNHFTGAEIYSGDHDSVKDALVAAVRDRAYLREANLSGANLSGANLSGSNLSGARIDDFTLSHWIAQIRRSDGYEFFAFATDKGSLIRAGCRTMLLADYRAHVAKEYPDTDKARETTDILDFIERRVK